MVTRLLYGKTYKQNLRLLRQCYRHGFYCVSEYVSNLTDNIHITLRKCNYQIHMIMPNSYTDIWGIKHTWTDYLQSKGVI